MPQDKDRVRLQLDLPPLIATLTAILGQRESGQD
jgi:hypothetical protein